MPDEPKPETVGALQSDLSWTMVALGLRGDVIAPPKTGSGPAEEGLDALFQTDPLSERTGSEAESRWTAEAAYGFPVFGGRFTGSPQVGLAADARSQRTPGVLRPPGHPEGVSSETGGPAGLDAQAGWSNHPCAQGPQDEAFVWGAFGLFQKSSSRRPSGRNLKEGHSLKPAGCG